MHDDVYLKVVVMIVTLALLALIPTCGGCEVSQARTSEVLAAQGFTDGKTTGYAWLGCGDDTFGSHFTATSPTGEPVEGVICCGWVKSCTVRW